MFSDKKRKEKSNRLPNPSVSVDSPNLIPCLDDVMLFEKSRRYSMSFENQFHYAVFFAYLKLKEQEIKNLDWLAQLVSLGVNKNKPGWNKIIIPFKYHKDEEQQQQ